MATERDAPRPRHLALPRPMPATTDRGRPGNGPDQDASPPSRSRSRSSGASRGTSPADAETAAQGDLPIGVAASPVFAEVPGPLGPGAERGGSSPPPPCGFNGLPDRPVRPRRHLSGAHRPGVGQYRARGIEGFVAAISSPDEPGQRPTVSADQSWPGSFCPVRHDRPGTIPTTPPRGPAPTQRASPAQGPESRRVPGRRHWPSGGEAALRALRRR